MTGYIYILREREFVRLSESTYKIGKTTQQAHRRFASYPKESEIILCGAVSDCHLAERQLIEAFCSSFKQMKRYGTEYFKGEISKMLPIMFKVILDNMPDDGESEPSEESYPPEESFPELPDPVDSEAVDPSEYTSSITTTTENTKTITKLTFGKHMGKSLKAIKSIDEKYLRWLLTQQLDGTTKWARNQGLIDSLIKMGIKPLVA